MLIGRLPLPSDPVTRAAPGLIAPDHGGAQFATLPGSLGFM